MTRYAGRTLIGSPSTATWGGPAASSAPAAITTAIYTSSTTWTCPTGVSYVNVRMSGGGGGVGTSVGGNGGTTSFSGTGITTFSCVGGNGTRQYYTGDYSAVAGQTSSGLGAQQGGQSNYSALTQSAQDGLELEDGFTVSAGTVYTITIGAGGTAGTSGAAGGGGYIELTYQVGTPTIKRKLFTAGGTFTVPSGVTTVRATVVAGAGGTSDVEGTSPTAGNSSAAFSSGTITAVGGKTLGNYNRGPNWNSQAYNGLANSGKPGRGMWTSTGGSIAWNCLGQAGQVNKRWVSTTPAESVTITVGTGASGNLSSGGSGYVLIEWNE